MDNKAGRTVGQSGVTSVGRKRFAILLPVRECLETTVVLKATAAVECGHVTSKGPARVLR